MQRPDAGRPAPGDGPPKPQQSRLSPGCQAACGPSGAELLGRSAGPAGRGAMPGARRGPRRVRDAVLRAQGPVGGGLPLGDREPSRPGSLEALPI
jgi:hypothetical protein